MWCSGVLATLASPTVVQDRIFGDHDHAFADDDAVGGIGFLESAVILDVDTATDASILVDDGSFDPRAGIDAQERFAAVLGTADVSLLTQGIVRSTEQMFS